MVTHYFDRLEGNILSALAAPIARRPEPALQGNFPAKTSILLRQNDGFERSRCFGWRLWRYESFRSRVRLLLLDIQTNYRAWSYKRLFRTGLRRGNFIPIKWNRNRYWGRNRWCRKINRGSGYETFTFSFWGIRLSSIFLCRVV